MRRRSEIEQLRKIAAVRQLQCDAAEARAARATAAISEKKDVLQRVSDQREDAEQHWQDANNRDTIILELRSAWMAQVRIEDDHVRRAEGAVEDANVAHELSVQAFLAARKRTEMAEGVADQAMRERLHHLEEGALQEASDLHLQKRSGP